ncbi:MAG: S8 family serine peptidase [Candidatus Zixiibacteriota bacterium]|nr:MAG: S8 family serine peptidase [candidate division Zixibacteria bacterium]
MKCVRFAVGWSIRLLSVVLLAGLNSYAGSLDGDYDRVARLESCGLIVKFSPETAPRMLATEKGRVMTGISTLDQLGDKYQARSISRLFSAGKGTQASEPLAHVYLITTEPGVDLEAMGHDYEKLPGVVYAEPDYRVELYTRPDDEFYQHQWGLHNTGQGHYHIVRQPGAENDKMIITCGISDADIDADEILKNPPDNTVIAVVAVLDSGIDITHPDLAGQIWTNPREVPDNGIDDDHNGYVDDVIGWDFSSNPNSPIPEDNDPADILGHGTHIAGIIAAAPDNGIGVVGVAPDSRIMALKILPWALLSKISRAIVYAAENGADVVNMSFGLPFRSRLLEETLVFARSRGVVFCAAIGNSGVEELVFPAGYPSAMAIGATNDSDRVASFSTYGDHINLCAPGRSILSLRAVNTDSYAAFPSLEPRVHIIDSLYYLSSGTSMACPFVVGAVAYLRAISPGLSPDKIQDILQSTSDDYLDPFGDGQELPGWDTYSGYGRLNLRNALEAAPAVRARIESPMSNEILAGSVPVSGIADGADFEDYVLDYGAGFNPESWSTIAGSDMPVTGGFLAQWHTGTLPSGRYTLRLRVGADNVSCVSVHVAGACESRIATPAANDTISQFATVFGSAYCPDFSHAVLEYGEGDMPEHWEPVREITIPLYDEFITSWYFAGRDDGLYSLRWSVYSDAGLETADTVAVYVQSVFSTDRAWKVPIGASASVITNYGDFDGDGTAEILVGTRFGILAFNPDGTLKTEGLPGFPENDFLVPLAVGHLDNDGIDDIVALGYEPMTVYGFPSSGTPFEYQLEDELPTGQQFLAEHTSSKIFLKDINHDGLDEIHVFLFKGVYSKAYLFTPSGYMITTLKNTVDYLPIDMNHDAWDELYIYNQLKGILKAVDYSGYTRDSVFIERDGVMLSLLGMTAQDINSDGRHELIVYGNFPYSGFWIYAFKDGFIPVAGWPREMEIDEYLVPTVPIFGDFDGDGQLEYFTTYYDFSESYIMAWEIDGTPIISDHGSGHFIHVPYPSILSMLLLADMDNDTRPDIVACANNDVFGSFLVQRPYAWSSSAEVLDDFPFIASQGTASSYRYTPTVGDINGDGYVDLTMTTPDSNLIFVSFPGNDFSPQTSPAPMWRYNRRLNGIGHIQVPAPPTGIDDNPALVPETFSLAQNRPNPFNPSTEIRYSLPSRIHVTLEVFNVLGQRVRTLVDEIRSAGAHHVVWNGNDDRGAPVASGLYLYRISAGNFVDVKKMVLLK